MEFTPWAILVKFLIAPILRYSKRPKIHLNVEVDSSTTGNLRTVTRFALSADNKLSIGSSISNDSSNVYVNIRNLSDQAILIDEIGAKVMQLRRGALRMEIPLLLRPLQLFRVVQNSLARKMMLRLATSGTLAGQLNAKGPIRLEGYGYIRQFVGTVDSAELIAAAMKIRPPTLVPYCIAGNQSHAIQYESIVVIAGTN